jgi:hypothetical protein
MAATLDPSVNASGAEEMQTSSMIASLKFMQMLGDALAKSMGNDPNTIELFVGSRKAYPSDNPDHKLASKLQDGLTNPDSKASIRIFAIVDGKREEIFRQTQGVVVKDPNGLKENLGQLLNPTPEPKLQAEPSIIEPTIKTTDPKKVYMDLLQNAIVEIPEADRDLCSSYEQLSEFAEKYPERAADIDEVVRVEGKLFGLDEKSLAHVMANSPALSRQDLTQSNDPLLSVDRANNVNSLQHPQELFAARIDTLQTELVNIKQQLTQALGQMQLLTTHVTKMAADNPKVQEWATSARQAFEQKSEGLMERLKSSALTLASNAWEGVQKWAIESPKIDDSIDELIERGGVNAGGKPISLEDYGGQIQLGSFVFSNLGGNRTISSADTGVVLYSKGLLSDSAKPKDIAEICKVPEKAERYCKAYDKAQDQEQKQQQKQEPAKVSMKR